MTTSRCIAGGKMVRAARAAGGAVVVAVSELVEEEDRLRYLAEHGALSRC
jgi:hypothetical protein